MQFLKNWLIVGLMTVTIVFSGLTKGHALTLTQISDFTAVAKEMSTYLSNRTPFIASLGRNDYRAALPGSIAPMPSFLISAGAGLGLLGDINTIQDSNANVTAIGIGSLTTFPMLVGPSFYARVAIPWLPIIGGFDVGFKFIPSVEITADNLKYKNQGFGFDIRYALLRDIPLIPLIHLSLAVGYAYDQMKGSFTTTGDITYSGTSIGTATFGPEWDAKSNEIFLQATAKIFIFALKVGAGYIIRGGETSTALTVDGIKVVTSTVKADGGHAKLTGGLGITFFPFLSLYAEVNKNMDNGDIAATGALNFTF